jgi:hypothetical protein
LPKNEIEELKKFGEKVKTNTEKIDIKQKDLIIIKKSKIYIYKIFNYIGLSFIKSLKYLGYKIKKRLNNYSREIKRKYSNWDIKKQKNKKYKIVEKKKVCKNKVIIVRKRVPYKYKTSNISSINPDMNSIYYLSIKENVDGILETNNENYTSIKESVWDFPLIKRKKN